MARHSLKRFAMPFLQASLVKQILIGLILGIALAYLAPEAAKASAFLGSLFISALKAVAPLLVFVLVMSAIANQDIETKAHIKPVLVLYLFASVGDVALGLFLAVALLVSIVLHELAHSVVAMAFGGRVRDITLQLMGGCAAITRMPPKPWQECLMAVAGPVCSLLLAGIAWLLAVTLTMEQAIGYDIFGRVVTVMQPNVWLAVAALLNLGLACFNLVPAFPMDGGRVLRSLLQTAGGMTKVRATEIAVAVGRGFAVLWAFMSVLAFMGIRLPAPEALPGAAAYLWNIVFGSGGLLLLCIAYMIWVSGKRELDFVRAEAYYGGWR